MNRVPTLYKYTTVNTTAHLVNGCIQMDIFSVLAENDKTEYFSENTQFLYLCFGG